MKLDKYGEYKPTLSEEYLKSEKSASVCPFLSPELNEDKLGEEFLDAKDHYHNGLGYYNSLFAGYVKEGSFRSNGTSGGMGTWIGVELLSQGLIDGIIHVKAQPRSSTNDPYYGYSISRNKTEALEGAKTKYHVVEISSVLREVKKSPGRYLFIGVPCLVKSIRRLQREDQSLKERIPFTISLVCGHFKSVNWTKSLGWAAGIHPNELETFQYRTKGDGIPARKYVFRAFKNKDKYIQKDAANVVGGKFNQGAMMLPACNFCDDVVGETADMTIGDAWLPRFESDDNGTNLMIVRNEILRNVLFHAAENSRLELHELSADEAYKSQSGGFRQRREGLSYRLALKEKSNQWAPTKRVSANQYKVPGIRKVIYKKRMEISDIARETFYEAMQKDNYSIYTDKVGKKLKTLRKIELTSTLFRSLTTYASIRIMKLINKG
ncbi:coenzyme F420 hydrogenase [Echinicola rosea]|uniref:Coenzyme F420 hydrogenase n=2 Tax=Echinicola rosea TaxID=1807691 RepID=A0ABQ1V1R4_9BACT|nr:coenzyme F420 hydrogenase [Echinicola rosea]